MAEDLWPVACDVAELEIALMNLCVNARDAMPKGGLITLEGRNRTLTGQEEQTAGLTGDFVALSVTDTGTGIASDNISKVFEPFFTTKEVGSGTGLGLSTVYGIVRQCDGAITVYSHPGRGSTFKIYLPRVAGAALEQPLEVEPHPAPASAPNGNGTETAAMADKRLFYGSTHQVPLYPGTGMTSDPAHPNVINLGLPPGAGSEAFRAAMSGTLLPALDLGWELMRIDAMEFWGDLSFLKGGVVFSRMITTVSPRYAHEIQTPEFGFGFELTKTAKEDDLYGVLKRYSASLILLFLLAASSVTAAYGHGLGTDKSRPVTISDKQVVVEATMNPTFIDQVAGSNPTFVVRALDDSKLNTTIPGIDFRIVVELRNEMLLDQRFRSSDGVVAANLVPDEEIEGWQTNGNQPADQVEVNQSSPVELSSRILSAGGLYHIAVTIESGSPGIAVDEDKKFDLYVSVGRTYTYDVQGGQMLAMYIDPAITLPPGVARIDQAIDILAFDQPRQHFQPRFGFFDRL